MKALKALIEVLNVINNAGINYCHWKSNNNLGDSLQGNSDLDILVTSSDLHKLKSILLQNGFVEMYTLTSKYQPGIYHFYKFDTECSKIIHFHLFVDLITGNGVVKNFHLPFRDMLLKETRLHKNLILVPSLEAEFVVFIFRLLSKQGNLFDFRNFLKEKKQIMDEFKTFIKHISCKKVLVLLQSHHANEFLVPFYHQAVQYLKAKSWIRLFILGIKFKRTANWYRYPCFVAMYMEMKTIFRYLCCKMRKENTVRFGSPTPIVVLIGGPASGKTTLTKNITKILHPYLDVHYFHVGKPEASWIFCWIRFFLPLMRKMLPHHTSTYLEKTQQLGTLVEFSYLHVFRKLILAYERKKLITKIVRKSMSGSLCLCDRYPLNNKFLTDGSTFSDHDIAFEHSNFKRMLMRMEKRIYQTFPKPNLTFFLKTSPKVALLRNNTRLQSYKDETYLLFRHKLLCEIEKFYDGDSSFYIINTETMGEEHCSNFIISSILKNI
ncbi:MAG: hypothetical protein LBB19_04110 [Puniceicoccales bacterium]|jgi:thymidylate kinase|nr:hypothetical protein [Puniceicoccales bacterium]